VAPNVNFFRLNKRYDIFRLSNII